MLFRGARATGLLFLGLATAVPVAAVSGALESAQAAEAPGNQSVRNRNQPEFDPIGVRVGGFTLYPRVSADVEWNDNVFADETNEVDDMAFTVGAGARLNSGWSQHALGLEASIQNTTYSDLDEETDPVWSIGADGRLNIRRDTTATGNVSYRHQYEARGSYDPAGLAEPIQFDSFRAGGRLSREFNRVRLTGQVDYENNDYDDGRLFNNTPVDQDFRDHDAVELTGRGEWALSPDTSLFAALSHRWNTYDEDTFGNRDFDRTRILGGAAFDLTNLVRGEFGLGVSSASYDDGVTPDFDGFSMRGSIDWFITQLTTLNFAADRDVSDSGDVNAASVVVTDIGVRVDHELYRNVILWARAGMADEEYEGVAFDRSDEIRSGSFGADWLVNRWAAVRARFTRTERESEGANRFRDYEQSRATIGVTLRR